MIGSMTGVFFAERFGRLNALRITGLLSLLLACALGFASTEFWPMSIIRAVLGIPIGFSNVLGPLYMSEVAPPEEQGRLGTIFQISVCASILLAMGTNSLFETFFDFGAAGSSWEWKLQFAMGGVPGLFLLVQSQCFLSESPKWRAVPNSYMDVPAASPEGAEYEEDGRAYNTSDDSSEDGHVTSPPPQRPRRGPPRTAAGWAFLLSRAGVGNLGIAFILAAINQLTGINAVIFYSPDIFAAAGLQNTLLVTLLVVGLWNLVTVFISFALVERMGRRPLMLCALVVMTLGACALGLSYTLDIHPLAICGIMLFIAGFEVILLYYNMSAFLHIRARGGPGSSVLRHGHRGLPCLRSQRGPGIHADDLLGLQHYDHLRVPTRIGTAGVGPDILGPGRHQRDHGATRDCVP
jgi:MFS family permease